MTCQLSLVVASGVHSVAVVLGFLIVVASLVGEHRLQRHMGSVAVASGLYSTGSVVVAGLVAPQHAGTSQTRDGSRVSCIGRQILSCSANREALK